MGVAFTPMYFYGDDVFYKSDKIDIGHPYHLNSMHHTLLDATLLRDGAQKPFLRINPQALCFTRDIANNVRIEQQYVEDDASIPQMDRVFLYYWLLKYPVSIRQNDRLMIWTRRHENQTCGKKHKSAGNKLEIQAHKELSDRLIQSLDDYTFEQIITLRNQELTKIGK
jgi:hypothetical protein